MGKGLKGVSKKLRKSIDPTQPETTSTVEQPALYVRKLPQLPPTSTTTTTPTGGGDESTKPKNKNITPSDSESGSIHNVRFENLDDEEEEEEKYLQGNWPHFKPTKRFDYADLEHRGDRHFGVNVATECETYFRAQRIRMKEKITEHFAFIVDLDAYEYHKVVFHLFLNEILESWFFRISIMVLVIINAILIGIQTDVSMVEKYSLWFSIIDQVILSVFLFEIMIKWIYDFRLFWRVGWNILDFTIIFLIGLAAVIPALRNSGYLVVVRVVRAFRVLRSVSFLSSLKVVMHTITRSGIDTGNILLVLMIFMLVMSIMGVILFDFPDLETKHFLSAVDAWFVLFICVTQDGWNQILDGFRGNKYFPYLALYLIVAVSIGAFVFANLIVAVIVANLELSVKEMREDQKRENNPLVFNPKVSGNVVEMLPIYDIVCKHSKRMLSQRPLRIPNLRKLSQRKIQTYVNLIVALEQNMLEAEIIQNDLEKILSVVLSAVFQLDMFSQQKAHTNELEQTFSEALFKSKKIDGATNLIPPPTASQAKSDTYKSKVKEREAAEAEKAANKAQEKLDTRKASRNSDLAYMQLVKNRGTETQKQKDEFALPERKPKRKKSKKKVKTKSKSKPKKKHRHHKGGPIYTSKGGPKH